MKRYILFPVMFVALVMSSHGVKAQVEDVLNPLLQYINKENGLRFTAGARLFADVAYYHSEYTPMKSGAAITDARIRTSLTYKQFYFYADFDFSKGKFTQKNIFVRYNFCESPFGIHSLRAGYFNEPSSMSLNASLYNYHFIARAAPAMALSAGRGLGITYKYYDARFFADQGIFAENKYNDQISGFQGVSLSGRWLYKPINDEDVTLHIGATFHYARTNTGEVVDNVFRTNMELESNMQTYVDATTKFLNADVPWAKNTITFGPEVLVKSDYWFFRGEYIYKRIYKKRNDRELFENQLGGVWSWTTQESWLAGNPIRSSKFQGAYAEMGYLLRGNGYEYDDEYGLLGGCNNKGDLEVVARYSYTELNDINKGDFFLIGKHVFYPNGVVSDYPPVSTSIGGGRLHTATVGINYTFSPYIKVMGEYQYSNLKNVYYPLDKNFHQLQARLMVSF